MIMVLMNHFVAFSIMVVFWFEVSDIIELS